MEWAFDRHCQRPEHRGQLTSRAARDRAGSASSADATAFAVGIYLSKSPTHFQGSVRIGEVDFPGLTQNTATQASEQITLPPQLPGFPGNGGKVYIIYRVNDTGESA